MPVSGSADKIPAWHGSPKDKGPDNFTAAIKHTLTIIETQLLPMLGIAMGFDN